MVIDCDWSLELGQNYIKPKKLQLIFIWLMCITFLKCRLGSMPKFEFNHIDNPFVDWNKTGLFTSMASALLHSNSLEADFRHIYISTDHFLWRLGIRHLGVDLVWMKCILLHFHCIIFEPSGNTRLINNTKLRLFTSCGQDQNLFDPIYLI